MLTAQNFVTAVRLEAKNSANDAPPPANHNPSVTNWPFLSVSKPSWVVRTESNVQKEQRKKPDPPCVVCKGSGRVNCHDCCGTGRKNYTHLAILPKGEWPKWCRSCGGSGLDYCSRCVGTGEYRYIMGFQCMYKDRDEHQGAKKHEVDAKVCSSNEQLDLDRKKNDDTFLF